MAISNDNQVWMSLTMQSQHWSFEIQPRYSDGQKKIYETHFRPAVFYKTDKLGTFHLGYLSRINFESNEIEKRYWTQWSKTYGIENYKLSTRVRYELRDLSLPERSQRLRVTGRLTKEDLLIMQFKPLVSLELFYNINDVSPAVESGVKQSRTSVGLSQKFKNQVTAEFLLTKNLIDLPIAEDQDNNILQIILIKEF